MHILIHIHVRFSAVEGRTVRPLIFEGGYQISRISQFDDNREIKYPRNSMYIVYSECNNKLINCEMK